MENVLRHVSNQSSFFLVLSVTIIKSIILSKKNLWLYN